MEITSVVDEEQDEGSGIYEDEHQMNKQGHISHVTTGTFICSK
jgi:hypothetical protein